MQLCVESDGSRVVSISSLLPCQLLSEGGMVSYGSKFVVIGFISNVSTTHIFDMFTISL